MKSAVRKIIGSTSAALAVAVGAALLAPPAAQAAPVYPFADPDPFYGAPADVGARADGDVLASRPVAATGFPTADAWQVKYKSTNSAGAPIAAVTTVLVPRGTPANRPLVSYQPFVNALGLECAPSHQLFNGGIQEGPALNALLARGWAVAVPDHLGPTSAYGAAKLGGRLVLDGVRAAQRLPEAGLGGSPVGLAGYSGGAMATNWAAALAPTYAPELNIVGAAQGGTPVNIGELADRLGTTRSQAFGLGFAAAIGLEREYPTRSPLGDGLNGAGLDLRTQMSNMCTDSILGAGAGKSLPDLTNGPGILADPSGRSVMDENSVELYPGVPRTPMFVWHGSADPLVAIGPVQNTVARYCSQGARVQFDVVPGADHGTATMLGAGPAFGYLGDRFAGIPAPSNC
ncbi:lipase [Rhodococcus opacus]|uniref:Lipase n=1 Tax=Rhodococcus opacus TaxID=37919 RepID=A0A1B1KA45_RHOOP|nr:lipase family protein [Rhodococcus opacus]ANS29449.1 lipase [Rhodococcus opacus]